MEYLPLPVAMLLAGGFIALLSFVLLLNIFGLPANWIIMGLVVLWKLAIPGTSGMGLLFWIILVGLAILGECLETGIQLIKARKYGSSSSGAFGGMIGAIVGAILLAPLFWGIGAFLGALAGAWLGCFCIEIIKGNTPYASGTAALGTMLGRFLGTICKIGIGAAMIAFTWHYIWPDMPDYAPEEEYVTLSQNSTLDCP